MSDGQAFAALALELHEDLQHAIRRLLGPDDRATARAVFPAAFELQGDRVWSARSLLVDAMERRGPAGQHVIHVITDYATDTGGLRQFGHFLSRVAGATFDGVRLVEVGAPDANGDCQYLVRRVRVLDPSKPGAVLATQPTDAED